MFEGEDEAGLVSFTQMGGPGQGGGSGKSKGKHTYVFSSLFTFIAPVKEKSTQTHTCDSIYFFVLFLLGGL